MRYAKGHCGIKRILIVNVNWIGDVLFSTPAIRALRQAYPGAYIACMVVPRCREVLELNPHLDELIIYDEKREYKGLTGKLRLIAALKARRFDIVFLFHRSLTRTLMVALSRIKERVGIYNPKRGFLLTEKVAPSGDGIHKVEQFLKIVRTKDAVGSSKNMELFIGKEDETFAEEYLISQGIKKDRLLVILNPGGNWDLKRWPAVNFAKLGDGLVDMFGARILITGAEKDVELGEKIYSIMKHKPVVSCGDTTIRQLAAFMKRSNLVIANDSGPMHIAVSQSAPTIALFGPTDPKVTGPYGEGRYLVIQKAPVRAGCKSPCYNLRCEDNACMKAISVEDVLDAARALLNQSIDL